MIAYRIVEMNHSTDVKHYYLNNEVEALRLAKKSKYRTVNVVKMEGEYQGSNQVSRFAGKPLEVLYDKRNGAVQK